MLKVIIEKRNVEGLERVKRQREERDRGNKIRAGLIGNATASQLTSYKPFIFPFPLFLFKK